MTELADGASRQQALSNPPGTASARPPNEASEPGSDGHSSSEPPTAQGPSISKRAAIGAGWIIAWRMASRNLGLINTLILVRLLAPSDFGLIALATGFIASIDALSAVGVQDALVRADRPSRAMYDTGFTLNLLRSITTAAIVAAIAWPVGAFFEDNRLTVVMLALSLGSLMMGLENIGIVTFRRDMAFEKEFIINVCHRITGVIVTVAVAAIWQSYWALVIGLLSARFIRLPLTYTMSSYRPRLTLCAWRSLIGFSLWTWAQSLLFQLRERSDTVIVGRFLGAAQLGIFTVGLELGLLPVTELVQPLTTALFPGFASLHNRAENLGSMFLGAVGAGFTLVLPAGVGISMVASPMVRVALGSNWDATVPVIQIMAVAGCMGLLSQTCATALNAIGRPDTTFHLGAATTVLKIGVLCVAVAYLGLTGAAIGLFALGVADLVLFLAATLPRIGVTLPQLLATLARPAAACLAMVLVLWSLGMAWTATTGTTVADAGLDAATRSAIGAATYLVALFGLWTAAGRPNGSERFLLDIALTALARCRRFARV